MGMRNGVIAAGILCFWWITSHSSDRGPWDLEVLFRVPDWKTVSQADHPDMKEVMYTSIPYKDQPVKVFAYYGTPDGPVPTGGWPAVVCVHGGGGTAFHQWVQKWNDHGYAAISMDLEGHLPVYNGGERENGRIPTPHPGPSRVGVFDDFQKSLEEQWYYHAVAQVILAHSLIRSFPEVNAGKTGITGISWGGTLTSTVMGVDHRFKFAIPVYGCGFLPHSDGHQGEAIEPGKKSEFVNRYYDGSTYFSNVVIPTFWVNGTNDKHFTLPSTHKSSQAVVGPTARRIELKMKHGHFPGWEPEEIYMFADTVLKGEPALIQLGEPRVSNDQVEVSYFSGRQISEAFLLYTEDTSAWPARQWEKVPAEVSQCTITVSPPPNATALFFNVVDEEGLMTSSALVQLK